MLAYSGYINSESPEPRTESGDELYPPPGGLCNLGFLQYMVHRWSERQVSYRETSWLQTYPSNSPTECGHSYRKP
jgi:hypothetical protein